MANAEFTRQQQNKHKGFDAGSYRKTEAAAPERALTPLQQKLAGLENALPAALRTQTVAAVLCAVMVAAAVFGLGGAKLKSRYTQVVNGFSAGVTVDDVYPIMGELNSRANHAANIITSAGNAAGVKAEYVQSAQAALNEFEAALENGGVKQLYEANLNLEAAIGQLYADMQANAPDAMKMGAVGNEFSLFNRKGTIISTSPYNDEVAQYNKEAGGFPAGLIGALWGVKEVEPFA